MDNFLLFVFGLCILFVILTAVGSLLFTRLPFFHESYKKLSEKDFSDQEVLAEKIRDQLINQKPSSGY